MTRRTTIYFDEPTHKALRLRAAETDQSVSDLVNAAVRRALAEDAEDLADFRARAKEPTLTFEDFLGGQKRAGHAVNVLIRGIPDDVLASIDANAKRVGLPRVEYLRRALTRERASFGQRVAVEDLSRFAQDFRDLTDRGVMRQAWE